MGNTYLPLYGVFDTSTGNLQGVAPVSGVVSSISGNPISVTGTATVGSVLTANLASGWTVTGYQWTRDGANISGATSSTYTLVSADSTHTVGVTVSGLTYAATGTVVGAAAAVAPVITTAPVISPISPGASVAWTPGTVTNTPTTVTYSLKKNGSVVSSNATSGSYSATTAGDIFIVTQSASNSAGSATPVDSSAVTVASTLPTYTLASETSAIVTAMTSSGTTPSARRQYTIDRWIKKMKTQGVWAKLSRFYMMGDTAGQSLINWVSPGTGDLTVVGAPVFTAPAAAYKAVANNTVGGYTATATSMALDCGVTLTQLYNAGTFSFGMYVGTTNNLAIEFGALDGTAGAILYAGNTTNLPGLRMCSVGTNPGALGTNDGTAFTAAVRTSASTSALYSQGQLIGTTTGDNIAAPTNGTRTLRYLTVNAVTGSNTTKSWQGGFVALQSLTAADIDLIYRAQRSIIESIQYADVLVNEAGFAPQSVSAQVVVYGWTLQGVHAAFEAARQGKTVALVGGWRDVSIGAIGGVSSNGLNRTDLNNIAALYGLSRVFISRTNAIDNVGDTQVNTTPRAVSLICRQMLDGSRTGGQNVSVYATGGIASATKSGTTITSITTMDGRTFSGAQFIDCTYEGDLMAAAGVSFTTGREASGTGGESVNGYRGINAANRPAKNPGGSSTYYDIDPFITPGVQGSGTIYGVNPTSATETVGQADALSQAFNFRLSFTTSHSRGFSVPTTPPTAYASSNYELFGRLAAAMVAGSTTYAITDGFLVAGGINTVYDFNNIGTTSSDVQNGSGAYVYAANYAAREVAWQNHLNWAKGLVYYYMYDTDSRISGQPVRTSMLAYYLPNDTYLDPHPNDQPYWPGQLYVREMRRMVGAMVWNGNDMTATDGTTPRSIKTLGVSNYSIDSHSIQRFADNSTGSWRVLCEGTFGQSSGGTDGIVPMPLEICVPQASECTNLSVAFCFSATHVAFGALRMEFTSAQVAQALGMLAAHCIDTGTTVQAADYPTLRDRLINPTTNATHTYSLLSGETAPTTSQLPQVN